jgi:signal transduction histidine kinase
VSGRWPLLSLGALLVAAGLVAANFPSATPPLPGWSSPFAILVPIGLFGATIRAARARADASAQRAALLEREREAATRAAVAEERARIARELHDVVSHHVSVMTIQAGAAGKVIDSRPDLAHQAVGAIESSGREAMSELRHLLGVLAPTDRVALRPQPGLDQLDALVANVRAAGQRVSTRIGDVALPRGIELTAYRVVQEALTNALRYAPGAHTEIVIERDGEGLVVEITNDDGVDPLPVNGTGVPGAGSGLLGLAERLRLYHGTLEAGRRLGGGFRVRARIPLEPT